MSDLRTELGAVLQAVEPGPPPVEATMRRGRRLRSRRRLAALTGSLAVAVLAAAGYPVLAHLGSAAPAPGPAVITETPGSSAGVVATGTIGDEHWQLSVSGPANQGLCYTGTVGRESLGTVCDLMPRPATAPVSWHVLSNGSYQGMITGVAKDVTYVVLTTKDNQELKLIPVTAGAPGDRFVGFIAPQDLDVTSATAYLSNGQLAPISQFIPPGWTRPGTDSPPEANADLSPAAAGGKSWIVNAQEGPFGTCIGAGHGNHPTSIACTTTAPMTALVAIGVAQAADGSRAIVYGSAPPLATSLRVTLTNGQSFTVEVKTVGTENLWAFSLGQGQGVKSWMALSADGNVAGVSPPPGAVSHSLVLPRLLREGR